MIGSNNHLTVISLHSGYVGFNFLLFRKPSLIAGVKILFCNVGAAFVMMDCCFYSRQTGLIVLKPSKHSSFTENPVSVGLCPSFHTPLSSESSKLVCGFNLCTGIYTTLSFLFSFLLLCSVLLSDAKNKCFRLFECKWCWKPCCWVSLLVLDDFKGGKGKSLLMYVWCIINIRKSGRSIVNA